MMELRFITTIFTVLTILVLFTLFRTYNPGNASLVSPMVTGPDHKGKPKLPYQLSPFTASWSSWFYPNAWVDSEASSQRAGRIDQSWNILYHLGGNGPWIQKIDGVVRDGIGPPKDCTVEQVHMISRHGERYPTFSSGQRMMTIMERLQNSSIDINGDLAFVKNWTFFSDDPSNDFEQLTTTGPYAGNLEAFATGVKLKTRYSHLMGKPLAGSNKLKYWASGSDRVEATAQYFATGLFGLNLDDSTTLKVIPELPELGGDTLTPGDTCIRYLEDEIEGHDFGQHQLARFQSHYLKPVAARLERQLSTGKRNVKIRFSDEEIYAMQEICGFETTVRGKSPWCDVFTKNEWESFEYARDLLHFYRSGPGNKFGTVLGSLWWNASAQILASGTKAGPFFFSFSHDGDIIPIVTTLELLKDDEPLPVTHVVRDRNWKISQVMPMGGRIIVERMSCKKLGSLGIIAEDSFVRININDGIVAIPHCSNGPGHSCPLENFLRIIEQKVAKAGNFKQKCGLPDGSKEGITFLHQ